MGEHCPASQYYDGLLGFCQPCRLRCTNLPSDCLKFNPCPRRTTNVPVTHKEVPTSSVGITITYSKGPDSPQAADNNNYMLWLVLALFVVAISIVFIVTIMLHRNRKLRAGYFADACSNVTTKSRFNSDESEQDQYNEIKKPVAESEDVDSPVNDNSYDNALSNYLFPLPAEEEGAAILVTTKTSACFNPGPGVRGDAFVEI
ncbi:tumor necrosis factor receptor superfamily member 17 [Hyla sarda]|uniref:tumor necrosis factor receptor superfamily member 17 n=1 Tax=Hyla sarda TaxID=327740 RepID=UPI0024C2BED5|nr:tumor necrosis factor receptor superfamily member 17 [Hyla sarda]